MRRHRRFINTIIIGGGPAGLGESRLLQRAGIEHRLFERNVIGHSFVSRTWPGFRLNTPNETNRVALGHAVGRDGEYATAAEFVAYLIRSAQGLPIELGVEVCSVRVLPSGRFLVVTTEGTYEAINVVVASGGLTKPHRPDWVYNLPADILVLDPVSYFGVGDLPDGKVLIVGGGATALQMAAVVNRAGRQVFLATSKVGRVPRRYRDVDGTLLMLRCGIYDEIKANLDLDAQREPQPQLSGASGGRSISYQALHATGVRLLGRVVSADGYSLSLNQDAGDNVRHADQLFKRDTARFEAYLVAENGTYPAPAEVDPFDEPAHGLYEIGGPAALNLREKGISCVIVCTGFRPTFDCLRDEPGAPRGFLDTNGRPIGPAG